MSISIKVLSFLSLAFASAATFAVPTLQLGIGGGEYDLLSETIVTSDHSFTLYDYGHATGNKAIDTSEKHYISIALTPQTGPATEPFGSFDFGGTPYDITDMVYGNPPIEAALGHDPGDLASHGVFDTFSLEFEFYFPASMTTASVNTEDDPGHVPTGSGSDLYFQSFNVDVSNLLPGFGLHFDLYNTDYKSYGDIDMDNFAPYSGDPPILISNVNAIHEVLTWKPRYDELDIVVKTSLDWERKLLERYPAKR